MKKLLQRYWKPFGFTLLTMLLYVAGRTLILPTFNQSATTIGGTGTQLLSLLTGGNLEKLSLFSLGVGPAITASIIIELLSHSIPHLIELKESGTKGRTKLATYIRYLSFLLAFTQGYAFLKLYSNLLTENTPTHILLTLTLLATGTLTLSWLGDQLSKYGFSQSGTSMIILFGILLELPGTIQSSIHTMGTFSIILYTIVLLIISFCVLFVSDGLRKVPVLYSKKGSSVTHLPIRATSTSVVSLIFASSFITTISILLSYINPLWYKEFTRLTSTTTWTGIIILLTAIIGFGILYALVLFDVEKIDNDLKKNGGYIANIRQGSETREYLTKEVIYTNLIGILLIAFLVISPAIISKFIPSLAGLTLGGTSIVLVINIATEVINNWEFIKKENKYKW